MSDWLELKERVSGKWQIPLFVLSLGTLAAAVVSIRPTAKSISPDQMAETLATLVAGEMYDQAVNTGRLALGVAGRTDSELAPVYLHMARARFGQAERMGERTPDAGVEIAEHYRLAAAHGQLLDGSDHERLGHVFEWQKLFVNAIDQFGRALAKGVQGEQDLRRHTLGIRLRHLAPGPDETHGLLDGFMADLEPHRLDLLMWALERKIDLFERTGKIERAATMLARQKSRLAHSDYHDRFAFLEALVLYKTGHVDEAELHARMIRNRVDRRDEVAAMAGWLLGRSVLADDGPKRPAEALAFFTDVIGDHATSEYGVASRIGRAEALAMLERHAEAIADYHLAIEDSTRFGDSDRVNLDTLRVSLSVRAESVRRAGDLSAALGYAELARDLMVGREDDQTALVIEQLGRIQALLGDELRQQAQDLRSRYAGTATVLDERGEPDEISQADRQIELSEADALATAATEQFEKASEAFVQLAQITTMHESRSAQASWRAADLAAKADAKDRAIGLYRAFVMERPRNPNVPEALLRVGQLYQAMGRLEEAIEAFRECHNRPRSLAGARALIPMAQCYFSMGPDFDDLTEKTLRIVLDDPEVFTPEAPEFAEASFLLGDVLSRRGAYELAITELEDALQRYPDDARGARGRFVLADSYRLSAMGLKADLDNARFAGEIQRLRIELSDRLGKARELYRLLIDTYEQSGVQDLDATQTQHLRYARLYEADCYYENKQHEQALKLYEEVAAMLNDTPSGLAAYVQIISCHLFLGQRAEAKAALARVLILTDTIPSETFARSISPEKREDWKQYFEWLADSGSF